MGTLVQDDNFLEAKEIRHFAKKVLKNCVSIKSLKTTDIENSTCLYSLLILMATLLSYSCLLGAYFGHRWTNL